MSPLSKRLPERDDELEEGSRAFLVTTPVILHQLHEELGATVLAEGDPLQASEENPAVVWVLGDAETNEVKRAITDHEPHSTDEGFYGLLAKVRKGEFLDDEEIQDALALLLERAGRGLI